MSKGKDSPVWRTDIDVEKLIYLYTVENLSLHSIQKETGIDRSVITRRLKASGIEIVKKPRCDKSKDNTPAKNKLFYKYRMQAQRRDIEFKLKYKDFLRIINEHCHYCGSEHSNREVTKSGHVLMYNGIDRLDNEQGYVLGNVVPCCRFCNQMKSDLSYDLFANQIKKIYEHILNNRIN